MCAINAVVSEELPSVLYVSFGVTPYNDRWCHPSRLGWVLGAVQSVAGEGAPVGTGAVHLFTRRRSNTVTRF
jgi:hypothetical protein